jgi:hypothetical protein
MTREDGFNRAAVNGFCDILEAELQKHNCNPNRIFHVLKTGLSIFQRKTKRKIFEVNTSIEEKSLVIVMACMSGARTCVPPMIIFSQGKLEQFLDKVVTTGGPERILQKKERTHCSRKFLVYLFIRFDRISYWPFIAMSYKFELSTYVQEPLVIGSRGCVQREI